MKQPAYLIRAAFVMLLYCAVGSAAPADSSSHRDPMQWPFASNSIWNMPIGSRAIYVPANLPAIPGNEAWALMPQLDQDIIVLTPDAPLTPVFLSDAAWTGKNRCEPSGGFLMEVPMPLDFVVPHGNGNNSAVFLAADRRTLLQNQPFTRCQANKGATALVKFKPVDLYGEGRHGSHGGSGLSALGGSLRIGELRPGGAAPRHALKADIYGKAYFFPCKEKSTCYRWPAFGADSDAVGRYGTGHKNVVQEIPPYAMRMGALLAIPAKKKLSSLGLETEPGKMLAWTMQNYGAYIVDDSGGPAFVLAGETGPTGSFQQQFRQDWGYDFEQRVRNNGPWTRDIQRIVKELHVVDNNGPFNIGGGGTPLQELAPALMVPESLPVPPPPKNNQLQ